MLFYFTFIIFVVLPAVGVLTPHRSQTASFSPLSPKYVHAKLLLFLGLVLKVLVDAIPDDDAITS